MKFYWSKILMLSKPKKTSSIADKIKNMQKAELPKKEEKEPPKKN